MLQQSSDYSPLSDSVDDTPAEGKKSCRREVYKAEMHTLTQERKKIHTQFLN